MGKKRLMVCDLIKEDGEELLRVERSATKGIVRDRVRLIRLLKEDPELLLGEAGHRVGGYKKSWAYQSFARYRKEGLEGLCRYELKGRQCRLNHEQRTNLIEAICSQDGVGSLRGAAALIKENTGISYCTSGAWFVLRRLGIKKKTGRPSHIHKDEAKAEDFKKKTFPS